MSGSAEALVEAHVAAHADLRHLVEPIRVLETEPVDVLNHVGVDRAGMDTGSETSVCHLSVAGRGSRSRTMRRMIRPSRQAILAHLLHWDVGWSTPPTSPCPRILPDASSIGASPVGEALSVRQPAAVDSALHVHLNKIVYIVHVRAKRNAKVRSKHFVPSSASASPRQSSVKSTRSSASMYLLR